MENLGEVLNTLRDSVQFLTKYGFSYAPAHVTPDGVRLWSDGSEEGHWISGCEHLPSTSNREERVVLWEDVEAQACEECLEELPDMDDEAGALQWAVEELVGTLTVLHGLEMTDIVTPHELITAPFPGEEETPDVLQKRVENSQELLDCIRDLDARQNYDVYYHDTPIRSVIAQWSKVLEDKVTNTKYWQHQLELHCKVSRGDDCACAQDAPEYQNTLALVEAEVWSVAGVKINDELVLIHREHVHPRTTVITPEVFYSLSDVDELREVGLVYSVLPGGPLQPARAKWAAAQTAARTAED